MPKFELTKSIEARKLNPRTRTPTNDWFTIPFGGILDNLVLNGDMQEFSYLGEFYQCAYADVKDYLSPVK